MHTYSLEFYKDGVLRGFGYHLGLLGLVKAFLGGKVMRRWKFYEGYEGIFC